MASNKLVKYLGYKVGKLMPDKMYLGLRYKKAFNKKINWKNPQTYNEKLQWLKLNDRNPLYTTLVDKYAVKDYVANIIGEEHIIPTLGVWDKFEDIDFEALPNEFVLKCTHDSGGLVIVKDKSKLDKNSAKEKIEKSLRTDFYLAGREWPYKNVPRKIIAEKFMVDDSGSGLKDYKFFCFDGKVKALFIATDRMKEGEEVKFDFFDRDFNHLPFKHGHENANCEIKKPEKFDEMIEIAEKLSQGIKHVRVDLYNINGQIYFGELTFYHHTGLVPFEPEQWDYTFGSWINL